MQTAANKLTQKAGPLPVWGWAALALAAWFLLLRGGISAGSASTGLPYTPASTGSAAQQPASGQGSAADNTNADLLSALLGNQSSSYDALLAALQYGGAGGGGFGGSSVPAGFGSSTAAVTAPTIEGPLSSAPVASFAADTSAQPPPYSPNGSPYDPETGAYLIATPGALQRSGKTPYAPDAVATYLVREIGYDPYVSSAPAMTTQTPYGYVSPAPVDTTSPTVADPRPLAAKTVAV